MSGSMKQHPLYCIESYMWIMVSLMLVVFMVYYYYFLCFR